MKKSLSVAILFCFLTLNIYAQRNTIRFIGFGYDNSMKAKGNSGPGVASNAFFPFTYTYERTFGDHLSLGINFTLPVARILPKRELKKDLYIDPDYNAPHSASYESQECMEYRLWGFSYNSKYFFSGFDEDPDGAYIAPLIGYDRYLLSMRQNYTHAYIHGSPSGDWTPMADFEKTYGVMRYGVKLGIQSGGGDLYIGYTFNSMGNRNDGLPFGLTTAVINSSNFMVGCIWGVSF